MITNNSKDKYSDYGAGGDCYKHIYEAGDSINSGAGGDYMDTRSDYGAGGDCHKHTYLQSW